MGFLFFALAFIILMRLLSKSSEAQSKSDVEIIKAKQCPPHKWRHVEVKDTEGNTAHWKIVCDICGPLNSIDRPSGGDYS